MRKKEVEIGAVYTAKISGNVVKVRILGVSPYGSGWAAQNLSTGRSVHIKSARKLRERVTA
jgi:hypothetical protein